jgi:multimeric flavodoxin WrbA
VPSYPVKVENGRLLIDLGNVTKRVKSPHPHHPLERPVVRAPGPLRLLGLSPTAIAPRFSGSDHVLQAAIDAAKKSGAESQTIKWNDLTFRTCEGYYSKSARACTWPCSITQMDTRVEMDRVYQALVHWSDAVMVASPIRWGAASSLYSEMAERLTPGSWPRVRPNWRSVVCRSHTT